MIGVIDYYAQPPRDYRDEFLPGQIYHAPIPFVLTENPTRLRLDYYDPATAHNSTFTLHKTELSSFKPEDDPRLRHLGLTSDDFLLSVAYKIRPVIVVSDPLADPSHDIAGYSGFLVVPSTAPMIPRATTSASSPLR